MGPGVLEGTGSTITDPYGRAFRGLVDQGYLGPHTETPQQDVITERGMALLEKREASLRNLMATVGRVLELSIPDFSNALSSMQSRYRRSVNR